MLHGLRRCLLAAPLLLLFAGLAQPENSLAASPTAVDDSRFVLQNRGYVTFDLLKNDVDVDEGSEIVSVTQPDHGTTAVLPSGLRVSYNLEPGFCGPPDEFTYTVNGGSTATVTLQVICTPPVRLVPGALRLVRGGVAAEVRCPWRFLYTDCHDVAVRLIGRPDRGPGKGVLIASRDVGFIKGTLSKRVVLELTERGRELVAERGGVMNVLAITSSAETEDARQSRTIRRPD